MGPWSDTGVLPTACWERLHDCTPDPECTELTQYAKWMTNVECKRVKLQLELKAH